MASILGLIQRNWLIMNPPAVPKNENALKFGILGAANIAPMALIKPAKSHPDVIIQCVAARDETKARDYAKKHGIPEVKKTYQDILDDPSISCIYIPLPNGLHYEWALKSLAAGKHVLLEKPSVSNATEAATLFASPHLATSSPITGTKLVLLEAFHFRFQPPWRTFLSLVDRENIESARAQMYAPSYIFSKDDIRFKFELAGGSLMDLGTYPLAAIREVFGTEPTECLDAETKTLPEPQEKTDFAFKARFKFPNDGVGEAEGSLAAGFREMGLPRCGVKHKPVQLNPNPASETGKEFERVQKAKGIKEDGEEVWRTRKVDMSNFVVGALWHKIVVEDEFVVKDSRDGRPLRRWTERRVVKGYTWAEAKAAGAGAGAGGVVVVPVEEEEPPGEAHWTTYRHQLEQFVEHVRGRKGTGIWIDGEDSVRQMKMIDMAYGMAGLPVRPTSEFQL